MPEADLSLGRNIHRVSFRESEKIRAELLRETQQHPSPICGNELVASCSLGLLTVP